VERVAADESEVERRLALRLGRRLQDLRLAKGMTQEQVAFAAGISRNHYQLMERGLSDRAKELPANPRLSSLRGIAGVLGLPVPDLVGLLLQEEPLAAGGRLEVPAEGDRPEKADRPRPGNRARRDQGRNG
jgi:transcriptional regulator with XRE-family HTH domain